MRTTLEESEAYAVASWKRFEDQVSDDLMRAICGAFALIAAADGDVSPSEVDRFIGVVRRRQTDLEPLDLDVAERTFRELASSLLSDPEAGRARALADVARVKASPLHRGLVRSAAYIAMIADARIDDSEQLVLAQIYEALGEPPEAI